jgi:hypothetical protein
MVALLQLPEIQLIDANGNPLVGASVHTYIPSSTTPKTTWSNSGGTVANTNPIVTDSAGRAIVWGTGSYRLIINDAAGNLIYDQVATCAEADIVQLTNIAALRAYTGSATGATVLGYYVASDGGGGPYAVLAGDATADNGGTVIVDGSGRHWHLQNLGARVSVKQFGAKGDGATDDTAAIIACITACTDIYFPGGATYALGTIQASPVAYMYGGNIYVNNKSGFTITAGDGATLLATTGANLSVQLFFYRCNNFRVDGLSHQGNRSGIDPANETDAYAVVSCTDFVIENAYVKGDWSGRGTAIVGDWMVRGVFRNFIGDAVATGADVAYLQDVRIEGWEMTGTGATLGSGCGYIGFSLIQDGPASGDNHTGVSFTIANDIEIVDCKWSNYGTGIVLATGNSITVRGGEIANNPGSGVAPGIGILITYYAAGFAASTAAPVTDVLIDGVLIGGNGTAVTGWGAYIDGSAIVTADVISGIQFANCQFLNNTNVGVDVNGVTHVTSVSVIGCYFNGAAQLVQIGPGILTGLVSSAAPLNAVVRANLGYQGGLLTSPAMPGGLGAGNAVVNTYPFPVVVTVHTQAFNFTTIICTAGSTRTLGITASGQCGLCATLAPGMKMGFTDAVPAAWDWVGLG